MPRPYHPLPPHTGRFVNHTPAPYSRKQLTDITLDENTLFII